MDKATNLTARRAELNRLLLECFTATVASCPHAESFKSSVDVLSELTDYLSFVDPLDAVMSLDLVLSRCKSCYYSSVSAFKNDFGLIRANAAAYNSPGRGEKANPDLIDWATALVKACEEVTEARRTRFDELKCAGKDFLPQHSDEHAEGSNTGDRSPSVLSGLEALVAACDLETGQPGPAVTASIPEKNVAPPRTLPAPDKPSRRHKSKVKVWIRLNKVSPFCASPTLRIFDPS